MDREALRKLIEQEEVVSELDLSGLDLSGLDLSGAAYQGYFLAALPCSFLAAALVGIGVSLIDIDKIAQLASQPQYLAFTVATVLVTAVVAGFVGWLLRLYFVESSITAGLCMTDLGGSGDIAMLGTTRRMHLLPFAQITSRLGGGMVLLSASGLLAYFYG